MDQYEGTALGDSCVYESERFKTIFRFTKRLINLKLTDHLNLYFLLIFASLNLFVFDFPLWSTSTASKQLLSDNN